MTNGDSERPGKASGLSGRLLWLLAVITLIVCGSGPAAAQNGVGAQPGTVAAFVAVQSVAAQIDTGIHALPQLQHVSATGVAAETVGRDAAESCLRNSFTADTPVTLADGKQEPISEVKVGDEVLATDPESGETKAEPVEQLIRHSGTHAMVLVTLADGSVLDSTDGHPIWDATTSQFTDAAKLHVGDKIETSTGALITIAALTTYTANLTAYNLQISTIHTYYAGTTPVLVHNSCDAADTANEGTYVVRSEAGKCVGQSGNITQRLAQHVSTGKFTQAEVDAAERFGVSGGKTAREIAEQLKVDSPEFGGIDNLLNKVNPIGVRRMDLMPDGYTR